MRLITHNLLKCNIRGLTEDQGYPLIIRAETTETISMEYNEDLLKNLLKKINFRGLASALKDLNLFERLVAAMEERNYAQEEIIEAFSNNEDFCRDLHQALFEFHLVNGMLVCPTTGREFLVKDGIPNMLLHEDEM